MTKEARRNKFFAYLTIAAIQFMGALMMRPGFGSAAYAFAGLCSVALAWIYLREIIKKD